MDKDHKDCEHIWKAIASCDSNEQQGRVGWCSICGTIKKTYDYSSDMYMYPSGG